MQKYPLARFRPPTDETARRDKFLSAILFAIVSIFWSPALSPNDNTCVAGNDVHTHRFFAVFPCRKSSVFSGPWLRKQLFFKNRAYLSKFFPSLACIVQWSTAMKISSARFHNLDNLIFTIEHVSPVRDPLSDARPFAFPSCGLKFQIPPGPPPGHETARGPPKQKFFPISEPPTCFCFVANLALNFTKKNLDSLLA